MRGEKRYSDSEKCRWWRGSMKCHILLPNQHCMYSGGKKVLSHYSVPLSLWPHCLKSSIINDRDGRAREGIIWFSLMGQLSQDVKSRCLPSCAYFCESTLTQWKQYTHQAFEVFFFNFQTHAQATCPSKTAADLTSETVAILCWVSAEMQAHTVWYFRHLASQMWFKKSPRWRMTKTTPSNTVTSDVRHSSRGTIPPQTEMC